MRMRKSEMGMRQSDKKMLAFEYEFSLTMVAWLTMVNIGHTMVKPWLTMVNFTVTML